MGNKIEDIVVIGGGPGGYVAAIRAAQLGAKVTLVEKEKLGGTCLNVGCVPTKALLHSASYMRMADESSSQGVNLELKSFDWTKVQENKENIVNKLVNGVSSLLAGNKIEVINGEASFINDSAIEIKTGKSSKVKKADKFIIATGSRSVDLPIPGLENNEHCINSTKALGLKELPKSVVIIGGGVIGVEMATIFNDFQLDVTIVEAEDNILPMMDKDLAKELEKSLKARGIKIYTGSRVELVENKNTEQHIKIKTKDKEEILKAEKVLVATGRRPYTDGLALKNAKIKEEKGKILVNENFQTSSPNIYAIGDCIGQIMLAHVASSQGEIAAENAATGSKKTFDPKTNPSCVYTNPEVASVGLSEDELKEKKLDYKSARFPLVANGKSLIENGGQGFVKVLLDKKYNEILGVHIIGPGATELIGQPALAIGVEATSDEIINTIHAHPTVSESIREAMMLADKKAIHMM